MRLWLLILIGVFFYVDVSFANLQVFPTRLVLTDKIRTTQISLRNKDIKPAKYRISLVYYNMKKDGSMELVKDPTKGENTAVNMIRFSPRQVALMPNEEQVVRVMSRVGAETGEGEYRAHIFFELEDEEVTLQKKAEKGKVEFNLRAKISVAVPVIVKKGNTSGQVTLSHLKIIPGKGEEKPSFSLEMSKTGNSFPYGDFKVYFTPDTKSPVLVAEADGVSSYIEKRVVKYPLNGSDIPLTGGILKAVFKQSVAEGEQTLASTETPLR